MEISAASLKKALGSLTVLKKKRIDFFFDAAKHDE
jgi:hypothetical protein